MLLWHYHDDDVAGPDAGVSLQLAGLPAGASVRLAEYVIDGNHSNAFSQWKLIGSPTAPNDAQYEQLRQAGRLATLESGHPLVTSPAGTAELAIVLPREAVELVTLEWP